MSEDELEVLRADFRNGRLEIRIEEASFDVHEYNQVCWIEKKYWQGGWI